MKRIINLLLLVILLPMTFASGTVTPREKVVQLQQVTVKVKKPAEDKYKGFMKDTLVPTQPLIDLSKKMENLDKQFDKELKDSVIIKKD